MGALFLMSEVPQYTRLPGELVPSRFPPALKIRTTESTGVPRSKERAPPWDPIVGLRLGPYCGYSEVDLLSLWYESVNLGAGKSLVLQIGDPKQSETDRRNSGAWRAFE